MMTSKIKLFIIILALTSSFIFIEKCVAEHDATFYSQLDDRMLELKNLVKKDYNQIADIAKYLNDNLVNTPDAFVAYTRQLIYIIYTSNILKDEKVLSLCLEILHKATNMNVDSSPYRMGEQIDMVNWEKEIAKQDNGAFKKFIELRRNKSEKILRIWSEIVSEIDDNWDENVASNAFNDVKIPWESIKGVTLSGIMLPPPESVEDELLRKKYQAELDEALKKQKRAEIQKDAKKVRQEKKSIVKNFLTDLYSNKPFVAKEELETLLKKYNIDNEFAKEVLDAIKK